MSLPVATLQTLADFLITGYWTTFSDQNGQGYPPHHFDHTNITYTFAGMTGPDAQKQTELAEDALRVWSDVCGLTFTEVASGGELYFSNQGTQSEANTSPIFEAVPFGELRYVGATVLMTQSFFTVKGQEIDSESFRAYVHEIGHALGLGHPGPYNVNVPFPGYKPDYSVDARFANDTEQFSAMSYFGQSNFGGGSDVGVSTPQMADIFAVQSLHKAAYTRPGDTIYGTNSNAGAVFDFGTYANPPAFTIYDSDGTDLLDCSTYSNYTSQYIDLKPGAFSSVGGESNNIGIWRLTTIENAKGGSGLDYITGNDAANDLEGDGNNDELLGHDGDDELSGGDGLDKLDGGNHNDTLTGGAGADELDGGYGSDTASYVDSPVGIVAHLWMGTAFGGDADGDTYVSIENLRGSMQGDVLSGDDSANVLFGEDGNDTLTGAGDADALIGGEGEDTVEYRASGSGVDVNLRTSQGHGGEAEGDLLIGVENVQGSNFNDRLTGDVNSNILWGNEGEDTLKGGGGDDTLRGGAHGDTYVLEDVTTKTFHLPGGLSFEDAVYDTVIEEGGQGMDTVQVQRASAGLVVKTTYMLPANVENGEVFGSSDFDLTGNELANHLVGNGAGNTLEGREGKDTLDGAGDYDTLRGGAHDDTYVLADVTTKFFETPFGFFVDTVYDGVVEEAAQGMDTVQVQRASDGLIEKVRYTLPANVENGEVRGTGDFNLTGNALANQLGGNGAANRLEGEGGDDILKGGGGDDVLDGGDDFDFASYALAPGGVVVDLGVGSAQNTVSAGFDTLIGIEGVIGSGFDDLLLRGFVQSATLRGGTGDDHFHDHNFGADTFDGGDDSDTIDYLTSGTESVRIDLAAGLATSVGGSVNTLISIENAAGSNGSDQITGNDEANKLDGRDGADIIAGGKGDDTLTGGPGADTYVFNTGDGTETLTDYRPAEGDRIDLTGVVGVHSFADLNVTQNGADTIITLGSGLVLQNFAMSDLAADQFLFSQPPSDVQLAGAAVAENSPAGTVVGALTATDADAEETFTFSLLDDAGGRFGIAGANLVVVGGLDYETAKSHVVTARVTDAVGNTFDKTLTVGVTNVIETRFGTPGDDVITIEAGGGVDAVEARAGNDVITIAPGMGQVVVDAGTGNDVIIGNGQTILSYASSTVGITYHTGTHSGLVQALLKNQATGEITNLQTRAGESDPVDFVSSDNPAFSPDGTKVAFESTAGLVPGAPGGTWNVYVKDLSPGANGALSIVSTSATGAFGNNNSLSSSYKVGWSPDGSKIAFNSDASNLVPGDSNGITDIFVKTVSGAGAGNIVRVTTAADGTQANGTSFNGTFSPDGNWVVFYSNATNLVAGDSNASSDIFLKNISTGGTYLISRTAAGAIGDLGSINPSFSPDGTKVVFESVAHNFAPPDVTGGDLFVKDISAIYTGGDPSNGALTRVATNALVGAWSPDGSKIAFHDLAGVYYVNADGTGRTLVSADTNGTIGNGQSVQAAWSADGRSITFWSFASNLVPGDTNGAGDVFVKDVSAPGSTGAIVRVSTDAAGLQGNGNSAFPSFSPTDSNLIVFESVATNLYTTNGPGNDKFSGIAAVWGSPFDDRLLGIDVNETFRGNAGNDIIQANNPNLVPGTDEADYSNSPAGITVNLGVVAQGNGFGSAKDGWGGTDILRFIENIRGSDFDDVINLDDHANAVWGNAGDDRISAGGGNDVVEGGAGNDRLAGGKGDDTVSGGPGADTIVYRSGDGTDTVSDFNPAEGDTIDLTGVAGFHDFGSLNITQVGTSTVITLGSGLILENFVKETLAPEQFFFSHAPNDILLSNVSVLENSPAGTVVGALTAVDADAGETFTFTLPDDALGRFAIDGTSVLVAGALDYEVAASHAVTVRVTDSAGNAYDEALVIGVTDVVGVTIAGSIKVDVIDATHTVAGQPFPTTEEDVIAGGNGNDVIDALDGDDVVDGGNGADRLNGSAGNDRLSGGNAQDQLFGDAGNDNLAGGNADDVIAGGAGNDTLDGGKGADALSGGAGDDIFAFVQGEAAGDSVADFTGNAAAVGDSLRFTGFGAGATLTPVGTSDFWSINYAAGQSETIRLVGVTSLHPTDYVFA